MSPTARLLALVSAVVGTSAAVLAHEYWIEPIAPVAAPSVPVSISAWTGEGFRGENAKPLTRQTLRTMKLRD
ncbi:MAG TPA: hypothetical protein VKE69_11505, partial [Planctomycetota bacterium]|nr:hypothetical protein [Planctomycetota bacterium]